MDEDMKMASGVDGEFLNFQKPWVAAAWVGLPMMQSIRKVVPNRPIPVELSPAQGTELERFLRQFIKGTVTASLTVNERAMGVKNLTSLYFGMII